MHIFLTLFTCLAISPLLAETIGYVEYQLPQATQEWEVGNKTTDQNGTTIVYIPKGASKEDLTEFFAVNANEYPTDLNDMESFNAVFKDEYPNMQVDVKVLEKGKDDILYEWTAKDKGQKSIYGLGRVFSSKEGTVLLEYENENPSSTEKGHNIWMPVLKQVKVVEKTITADANKSK